MSKDLLRKMFLKKRTTNSVFYEEKKLMMMYDVWLNDHFVGSFLEQQQQLLFLKWWSSSIYCHSINNNENHESKKLVQFFLHSDDRCLMMMLVCRLLLLSTESKKIKFLLYANHVLFCFVVLFISIWKQEEYFAVLFSRIANCFFAFFEKNQQKSGDSLLAEIAHWKPGQIKILIN